MGAWVVRGRVVWELIFKVTESEGTVSKKPEKLLGDRGGN